MLQRELTREQVLQVGEQILVAMEGHIVERGYAYFSDGVVFNTRVEKGVVLSCDVQGTHVYHVQLDLETVQNSTCNCSYSRLCKHVAAAFFQMYSVFDNPRNFLGRSQQPRRAKFSPAMLAPAFKNGANIPAPGSSAPDESPLRKNSTVREWWIFMENWTRNLSSAMESYRASSELLSSYQNVLGVAAAWPKDRAQLFSIHANLFHLLELQDFVRNNRQSNWFQDLSQTAERLLEQMEGMLYYANVPHLMEDHRSALEETLAIVKKLKDTDSSALYWSFAYQMIWGSLLQDPAWIQEEQEELDRLIEDPAVSDAAKEKYRLLRAHFYVMEGQDEAALKIWLPIRRLSLSFYLPYLKSFARNNEWQRFLDWIDWLERLIGVADAPQYRLITAIWQEAMEQVGRQDECGAMLKRFLPSSFQEYAAYLHENKRYKQWIDLQMAFQVPFSEIPSLYTKEIEDASPVLLFPLYLREVNRLIGERNRSAYKEAIKLMKKVRTTYSKANLDKRWEQYVDQLAAKHNRLRAFQEELRRGNLNV